MKRRKRYTSGDKDLTKMHLHKANRFWMRLISFVLVLASLLSGQIIMALALTTTEVSNGWTPTEAALSQSMDVEKAKSWVLSKLTTIYNDFDNESQKGSSADKVYLATKYAEYLSYIIWTLSQGYSSLDESAKTSIFSPKGMPSDYVGIKEAFTTLNLMRTKLKSPENNLVNIENNIADGKIPLDSAFTELPELPEPFSMETLMNSENFTMYAEAYNAMITRYIDAAILAAVASGTEGIDYGSATYETLKSDLETMYDFTADEKLAETLYNNYKDKIMPYIKMYTQMSAALKESRSYGVQDISNSSGGLRGYQRVIDVESWTKMSEVSTQLWEYHQKLTTDTANGDADGVTVDLKDYDLTGGILPLISNAYVINGKVTSDDGTFELTDMGYIMLAAGVVYDPFISVAGNEAYLETIKKFIVSESQRDDVSEILQRAMNYKKPIFVTTLTSDQLSDSKVEDFNTTADYKLATLSDMIPSNVGGLNVFTMVKGEMSPSEVDDSTWEYVNGVKSNTSDTSVEKTTDETTTVTESTTTTETDKDGKSTTTETSTETKEPSVDNRNMTIASETFVGAPEQVTKPVAVITGLDTSLYTTWAANNSNAGLGSIGSLTAMIIHNASQDVKSNSNLKNSSKELLFMNGLGDIVLEDNTIVLPAISNPILYTYDQESAIDYEVTESNLAERLSYGYYPYNAAFMNHYPVLGLSENNSWYTWSISGSDGWGKSGYTIAGDSNEKDKYLLQSGTLSGSNTLVLGKISAAKEGKITADASYKFYVPPIAVNSLCVTDDVAQLNTMLGINTARRSYSWYKPQESDFLMRTGGNTGMSMSFFPLNQPSGDLIGDFSDIGSYLTTSAVRFLAVKDDGEGTRMSKGTFDIERYIEEFAGQALMGTQYTSVIVKNYQVSYEDIVEDTGSRLLKFGKVIADFAVNNFGRIDGVLSIKNAYDNPFFNIVMRFVQEFYVLIAILLVLIVAVRFLKGHYSLFYVGLIAAIVVAGFEVYASWMPTLVPSMYNFAVNDTVEGIVWNTVANQAEEYEQTYADADRKDSASGQIKPYTSTITLYKLTSSEMEELTGRYGISAEEVKNGSTVMLDSDAGIFVKGNEIRMSIDSLFANNTMRGLYASQWAQLDSNEARDKNFITPVQAPSNDNPYTIQLTSPYTSIESYYMPFPYFERALMQNLNDFCSIFMLERHTFNYGDLTKDAFLVNNFLNSGIFVAPGRDDILEMNIVENSLDNTPIVKQDIIDLCNATFYPQEDWLKLRSVFAEPSEAMKESLWMQMLQRNEYYNRDWEMDEEKMTDLILYINNQTKHFIMDNMELFMFCSDENAIKLIALYATTAFTHRVSEVGYWLYPNYINTPDIELKDVLYGCMATVKDRNYASDGDVVNVLAVNNGLFGLIVVTLIAILSVAFIFILNYLVPILYVCLGGILIFKLVNAEQSIGVVKGYFKTTAVTVFLYFLYALGLQLVRISGYNWFGFLGCLLVTILCIYILFFVLLSIVQDFSELGNNSLASNLIRAMNKITRGAFDNLRTKALHVKNNTMRGFYNLRAVVDYSHSSNIDAQGRIVSSRRGSYGYNDYHQDYYRRTWGDRAYDLFSRTRRRSSNHLDSDGTDEYRRYR